MARQIALSYNWWSRFVRLAIPRRHAEPITSRPLLLTAVGKQTRHQGQTRLTLTSAHAKTGYIQRALPRLPRFFNECQGTAEQLGWAALWRKMLSRIFVAFLRGRPLRPPPLLPHPTSKHGSVRRWLRRNHILTAVFRFSQDLVEYIHNEQGAVLGAQFEFTIWQSASTWADPIGIILIAGGVVILSKQLQAFNVSAKGTH